MDSILSRAQILMQQGRFREAGEMLQNLLKEQPNNVHVLAMLAQVKLAENNTTAAEELINDAIGLSPDVDYLYYVKARVCLQQNNYDGAEENLEHCIKINPVDSDYFSLLASVKLSRKQYQVALDLADKALEFDPENIAALNTRSTALLKLNKKEESFTTIEGALAHDPNNAYTHANYGWGLLEKGDHKKALEHFSQALKNNPNLSTAQSGIVQALKAKYVVYRAFLKYAFFMSNLTAKYQWGVIIGLYVGTNLLRSLARTYSGLQPVLVPIIVLLALFAFSTWVITPISNLFLRLNPYGKYLVDKGEKTASTLVGISLLVCLGGITAYFIQSNESWLVVAVVGFGMMVPLGSRSLTSMRNKKMIAYAAMMLGLGIAAIISSFITADPFNIFSVLFLFCFIAYQWIANFLSIKRNNL